MSGRFADDGISADIVYGGEPREDWPDAHPYRVTLDYDGRSMTTPFYTGSGWTKEPDVDDVMECLASDASSVVNSRGFEEWADDLGFDPDSRKAERSYHQAKRQTDDLRELLGDDFDRIVLEEEGR
jgi:hypothetical protein